MFLQISIRTARSNSSSVRSRRLNRRPPRNRNTQQPKPLPPAEPLEPIGEPKIVLLVRLLNAIDEGRHSFEDLKRRIVEDDKRVSTRSLRRYLQILEEAGFPWYFDRAKNLYRFADGYSLKRL